MQIQVKNSSVEKLKLMTEFQLTEKLCLSDEAPQAGCHQGLPCGEALLLGLMRTLIGICSKIWVGDQPLLVHDGGRANNQQHEHTDAASKETYLEFRIIRIILQWWKWKHLKKNEDRNCNGDLYTEGWVTDIAKRGNLQPRYMELILWSRPRKMKDKSIPQ